jgi:hypothetical protein
MDNTLSWKHHIDILITKLCMACYIIRNAKKNISASSLKVIYPAFLHSATSNGIIFWENSLHSFTIFRLQKKTTRIMEGWGNKVSYRILFKKLQILPLTSQYMLSLLLFVAQNKNLFSTNNENHNLDTRQRNSLYLLQAYLTIYQKVAHYSGFKIYPWRLKLSLITKKV